MGKRKIICGVQQIGIGVSNVYQAWDWYRTELGFNAKFVDDQGVAERMLPYTGGKPQPRHAVLAANLQGGGGVEIWEPQQRELNYLDYTPELGDLGILACKIKAKDAEKTYKAFKRKGMNLISELVFNPDSQPHFFMYDPYGNLLQIEQDDYCLFDEGKLTGGCNGALIGVSDMDKSVDFYGKIAEYDKIIYDRQGIFPDLSGVPGGQHELRRVRLGRSKPLEGPLSRVYGTSYIELVQKIDISAPRKLYQDRFWGDPGYIQICFDVRNMEIVRKDCEQLGYPFVCDGGKDFKMGEANGHFTYIEDPDGTLIEFVETYRLPILKKLGIYLNLENRSDTKPLPWVIYRGMKFLEKRCETDSI